jgi:probable addiction module antidote protein
MNCAAIGWKTDKMTTPRPTSVRLPVPRHQVCVGALARSGLTCVANWLQFLGDRNSQNRSLFSIARRSARSSSESMKKKTAVTRYDVAEHLRTPEEMAAYLEACLEDANGDAAFIAKALGDIARAKGMAQVARDAGLSRESLYKALSGDRSPGFDTILKVIEALGLRLHAEANPR